MHIVSHYATVTKSWQGRLFSHNCRDEFTNSSRSSPNNPSLCWAISSHVISYNVTVMTIVTKMTISSQSRHNKLIDVVRCLRWQCTIISRRPIIMLRDIILSDIITRHIVLHDGHDNHDKENYFSHTQQNKITNIVHGLRWQCRITSHRPANMLSDMILQYS